MQSSAKGDGVAGDFHGALVHVVVDGRQSIRPGAVATINERHAAVVAGGAECVGPCSCDIYIAGEGCFIVRAVRKAVGGRRRVIWTIERRSVAVWVISVIDV